ncbi:ATP-binding protein [Oceanobacillus limi]|nr:ATP-binding protein [Oceanobacillus limi]
MDKYITKIASKKDVLLAISYTKDLINNMNFTTFEEQQILVCVSELTNNIVKHAGVEGTFTCFIQGHELHITASDKGKGIENVTAILEGNMDIDTAGLGRGLQLSNKYMDVFSITTKPNEGVTIVAVKVESH